VMAPMTAIHAQPGTSMDTNLVGSVAARKVDISAVIVQPGHSLGAP
jgi:hypothetical protein